MVDTEKLRKAIKHFEFWSSPSGSDSTPATVGDVKNLIKNTANVLREFVAELEQEK